jgi:transposase
MTHSNDTTHNHQHKTERLKEHRALNPHPHKVSDPLFSDPSCEFFDAHDLLQVKYEMLRAVAQEGCSVSEATRRFGFSRPCFYHTRAAFEQHGMAGLLRGHPGPKSARKFTEEVMEFIEQHVPEGEPLRARVLAPQIQERFGIEVHPRSIERAVKRRKKKESCSTRKYPAQSRR